VNLQQAAWTNFIEHALPHARQGVKDLYEIHDNSYGQRKFRSVEVPKGCAADIDNIDTCAMTIETLPGTYTRSQTIE